MQRPAAFLVIALFFIWILPLGYFIKPAQEKAACGGQRAICLCSHTQAKVKSPVVGGYALKANSGMNKEASASGGAGHYDLAAHLSLQNDLSVRVLNDSMLLSYRNPFLASTEYVPKV